MRVKGRYKCRDNEKVEHSGKGEEERESDRKIHLDGKIAKRTN